MLKLIINVWEHTLILWHIMLPKKCFAAVWTFNVMIRDNLKRELQLLLHRRSFLFVLIFNYSQQRCQNASQDMVNFLFNSEMRATSRSALSLSSQDMVNFLFNSEMRATPRSALSSVRTLWNTSSSFPSHGSTARIV